MNLNADAFFYFFQGFNDCISVKIDAKSGNLMENSVCDGKTVAHATEFPSNDPSV